MISSISSSAAILINRARYRKSTVVPFYFIYSSSSSSLLLVFFSSDSLVNPIRRDSSRLFSQVLLLFLFLFLVKRKRHTELTKRTPNDLHFEYDSRYRTDDRFEWRADVNWKTSFAWTESMVDSFRIGHERMERTQPLRRMKRAQERIDGSHTTQWIHAFRANVCALLPDSETGLLNSTLTALDALWCAIAFFTSEFDYSRSMLCAPSRMCCVAMQSASVSMLWRRIDAIAAIACVTELEDNTV